MEEDEHTTSVAPMPGIKDTSEEHKESAPGRVRIGIITVSDSRDMGTDESGRIIKELASPHEVVSHNIVKDKASLIRNEIRDMLLNSFNQVDAMIINGGTGVSYRDVSIEAVQPLFEKELTAFSIMFAGLSYGDIGSAAILSRATAGIYRGKVIFCIPGSPKACQLAMEKLITPELAHIVSHIGDIR